MSPPATVYDEPLKALTFDRSLYREIRTHIVVVAGTIKSKTSLQIHVDC
jgi:translation elongation factor EF-4